MQRYDLTITKRTSVAELAASFPLAAQHWINEAVSVSRAGIPIRPITGSDEDFHRAAYLHPLLEMNAEDDELILPQPQVTLRSIFHHVLCIHRYRFQRAPQLVDRRYRTRAPTGLECVLENRRVAPIELRVFRNEGGIILE